MEKVEIELRSFKMKEDTNLYLQNSTSFTNKQTEDFVPPDGGWGWMCVFACFVTFFLCLNTANTFGVIYSDVSNVFPDAKHAQIALIPSLTNMMLFAFAVFAGALIRAFSCRKMAVIGGFLSALGVILSSISTSVFSMQCMSVITGIGDCFVYTSGTIIVAKYFHKRRSQALGFALCGIGSGSMVSPFLTRYLADEYGFRGALLIRGGLLLNTCAVCLLYREPKLYKEIQNCQIIEREHQISSEDSLQNNDQSTRKSNSCFVWVDKYLYVDLTLLYNPVFVIISLASSFVSVTYPSAQVYFPSHAQFLGYSSYYGSLLLSVSSAGNLISRLVIGWISDKDVISKQIGFTICLMIVGLSTIAIGILSSFLWMSICSFLHGFFIGACYLLINVILAEEFGIDKLTSSFGILKTMQGLFRLIGPGLSGHLRDITGNFRLSIIVLGAFSITAAFIMCLIKPIQQRCKRKKLIVN